MNTIIYLFIGLSLGVVVAYLFLKAKHQRLQAEAEFLQKQMSEQKEEARQRIEELKAERLQKEQAMRDDFDRRLALQQKNAEVERRAALEAQATANDVLMASKERSFRQAIEAQEMRHNEAMKAQQMRFDETIEKMTAQLKSATDEMLKQHQKEFEVASNTNLGQIVMPLRETIDKMNRAMNESTIKQTEMSSALKENIERMMQQSIAAKQSADELTRALKHGSKVQGDWGEMVLDELLASQGLERGIHYDTQAVLRDADGHVVKSEEGSMMRPDVILHLDQRREVIIDSKVSLTAFFDYLNAEDDVTREKSLKAHIDSIQSHVKELSQKDYSSYVKPPKMKMDYVIMFVPHTGALWTALNAQPDLWRRAMERNVFIADEQTLFAALRIVNLTWTQIAQAQNHEHVYSLANEMIDRVGLFMKRYAAVGKALKAAESAYEDAGKKLQPTGKSILTTCAKLIKLGAKQSDKNPIPQLADVDTSTDVDLLEAHGDAEEEEQPSDVSPN